MRKLMMLCILIAFVLNTKTAYAEESVKVPIIMYHKISTDDSSYTAITPQMFERDLKFLSDNGYHTIGIKELVEYVYNNSDLPEKSIILTFDDGYYNNYIYALPLLEKYDMKIVMSVIGEDTIIWSKEGKNSLKYGHVTFEQIKEMYDSGRVEFANHTQSMHKNGARKGVMKRRGEDVTSYKSALTADVTSLQEMLENICGENPICFTYPFGCSSPESTDVLKAAGFKATLSCVSGVNYLKPGDPECLYDLKRCNRVPDSPIEKILSQFMKNA